MTGEARRFAMDLRREWEQEVEGFRGFVVQVATDALAGVVEKSPVDTGQFQNNWLVSAGEPDLRAVDWPGSFLQSNSTVIAAYIATEGFPTIFLQNNLPYATRLEDGWSDQAPNGMVALTVVELEAKYDGSRAR